MDEEELQVVEKPRAWRHDKWSFIVLVVDLAETITRDVADMLDATTNILLQHRQHKIEESRFYEAVMDHDDPS